jgi:RNA polymerase sigma-70 factor, ECF subfamily
MTVHLQLRTDTTTLLLSAGSPDSPDLDQLVPRIYDQLREMAQRHLAREQRDATLHTTELVHEAYLRLVDDDRVTAQGRAYFFGAAARAMRRVLIESARRRGAAKRGAGVAILTLDSQEGGDAAAVDDYAAELLDLDRALTLLERQNPRHARVVECRYFAGLSVEETATALGVSKRTVKSDWALARAWLFAALRGPAPAGES